MRHLSSAQLLLRALVVLVPWIWGSTSTRAQSTEQELAYKFSVQGITDPVGAKPIQYALMERSFTAFCTFIDECDCFKLSANTAIDYVTLKNVLNENGYVLAGDVLQADGSVLHPPANASER